MSIQIKEKYTGHYLNGVRHGYGKLYNCHGQLAYEGGWANGEPHGQGKEYSAGDLRYEGNFEHGNRHGRGVLFWPNQRPYYEGEWQQGLRHGRGKSLWPNGQIVYDGEWKCGDHHGKGVLYTYEDDGTPLCAEHTFSQGFRYEGEWKEGVGAHGLGKAFDATGRVCYEGGFLNGFMHGRGKQYDTRRIEENVVAFEGLFNNGHRYVGEWKENVGAHGTGKEYALNGHIFYEGEYQDRNYHGKGIGYRFGLKWFEGSFEAGAMVSGKFCDMRTGKCLYEGQSKDFRGPWGRGKEFDPETNELIYEGDFVKQRRHGKGKEYRKDRSLKYEGEWRNSLRHGTGALYVGGEAAHSGLFNHGDLYVGAWKDSAGAHGEGIAYHKNKQIKYQGSWADGLRHGQGKEYDDEGNLVYEGAFEHGNPAGFGRAYNMSFTQDQEGFWMC